MLNYQRVIPFLIEIHPIWDPKKNRSNMIQYIPILNIQYCKGHLISGNMITMLFGMMCRHVGSVPQHLGAGSWAATWLQHWIHISPALRARIRNHGETCKFTISNSSFDQSLQPREYTSPEQSWWNAVLLFVQGAYPWRFINEDGIIFHVCPVIVRWNGIFVEHPIWWR